jgi:hypothetical protein
MADESPHVRLPGRIYRRRSRWWWKVQLPGEDSPRSRALRPPGARQATTDRRLAGQIALTLWQEALQTEIQTRIDAKHAARMQRLRTRLRRRIRALRDTITRAGARAEQEARARTRLEADLSRLRERMVQTALCECCGRLVTECGLHRIDSGQRLCPNCLHELRRAAQQQSAGEPILCSVH